jgi:hypothetical protein
MVTMYSLEHFNNLQSQKGLIENCDQIINLINNQRKWQATWKTIKGNSC